MPSPLQQAEAMATRIALTTTPQCMAEPLREGRDANPYGVMAMVSAERMICRRGDCVKESSASSSNDIVGAGT